MQWQTGERPVVHSINRTIRNVKRYREILSVLVRYGFEDVVADTRLDLWIDAGKSLLGGNKADSETRRLPRAVRLRKALEDLGPTFIKLGQVLSTRPDLIPPDWAEEFKRLQDDCPQVEFELIRQRLEEEFAGTVDEVFSSIESDALAAASVAQVHRAVLKDGTKVVIKVLRPEIRKTIESDMEALSALAHFVERHFAERGYSPTEVVNEFSRELQKELDLTHEGRAADRFRRYFADDERVYFPRVYWEATTRSVLTLEEIPGILLSRRKEDDFTPEQRQEIIAAGADAVFRMCLEFGFFHADPHPGNIIVMPDIRVCFIDCGMTGRVDRKTSEQLADLVAGIAGGEVDRVINVVIALTSVDPSLAENRSFRADASDFISRFETDRIAGLDLGNLLQEFFELLRQYHIRCPSDMVFLIKAITTIEGVGEELDPDFDIIAYVRPHIEALISRRYSVRAISNRMRKSLFSYAELAETLPAEIRQLLTQLRNSRFSIALEHKRLDRLTETMDQASRHVSYALIVSALLVCSSILILADTSQKGTGFLRWLGVAGMIAALLFALLMALTRNRGRKRNKRK
ncbi:MAG TPA: AarF/ABC1/UbiB kinase family protein [Phycisphaeraceae bacterium]|nr:AarF/ABC1/UbiB kinase family protein [Phycisphaeraceae bacterium]